MTEPESPTPPVASRLPAPGVAAIALYLFLLAGVLVLGVAGGHYPKLYVAFPVLFLAAGGGLLMSFRWAWALALAAVFLISMYNLWAFTVQHQLPFILQGLLNFVFFLYLIRPEVRARLR
ncbi:MAG: hypothetical protein ACLGSD_16540 [Acidobacteriota bacterium]